jgi:deoxyribodipyrimidine photo-lyase
MDRYDDTRNFPSLKGPSNLGVHLRFGTVSLRHMVNIARQRMARGSAGAQTWLSELVWRDFYFQVVANFLQVATGSFKLEYDAIQWEVGERADALFAAWCEGRTGYMHNPLRMVAGSFLVKHLGIDWRWGVRYFAEKLNDFDLSANNSGWQWVSYSGCDAQPCFHIFNPTNQSEKFDAEGKFIKRNIPALKNLGGKKPMRPGPLSPRNSKPLVSRWGRLTHTLWWTTQPRAPKPCCGMEWSKNSIPKRHTF